MQAAAISTMEKSLVTAKDGKYLTFGLGGERNTASKSSR